jgi:hypothetical protein
MSSDMDLAAVHETLVRSGVVFEPGLSDAEFEAVESRFGFRFPPDLRRFLAYALPASDRWPNWRHEPHEILRARLEWPYEGICFDIENNAFWPAEWGEEPTSLDEARRIARQHVDAAPRLIPILAHRYLPDRPHQDGNPIFSVYQTDIIYYGRDLPTYLENEFSYYFGVQRTFHEPIRRIDFWSWLVDLNSRA